MNSSAKHQTSLCEQTLVAMVLVLVVWLPLPLGSNRDWSVGLLVLCAGVVGIVWTLGILSGKVKQPGLIENRSQQCLLLCLILGQLWVAVQCWTGITRDIGASFQYLMLGMAYTLIFAVILSVFDNRQRVTALLLTLVISGTVQAFYGAGAALLGGWSLLGMEGSYNPPVANGSFVNRNHLAGYLSMCLACAIGLLLALRDSQAFSWQRVLEVLCSPKVQLRLVLVIMVIALVMTRSRMGNVAFFSSLLVFGAMLFWVEKHHRLRNGLILGSIILIDILIISQYFGLARLQERIAATQLTDVVVAGEVIHKGTERVDIYQYALPLARERIWRGQGAGAFESVFPAYTGADIHRHYDHAHNDYLQFWIEYGLIGLLPLMIFVGMALYLAVQTLWCSASVYRRGVALGAGMGILAMLIHAWSDFNLQIPANALTFIILCALAVVARSHSNPESGKTE